MIKFNNIDPRKVEAAFLKAEDSFIHGRMNYTLDECGDGYPIVDALTPPGDTIDVGKEEIIMILDSLLPGILEAFVNA